LAMVNVGEGGSSEKGNTAGQLGELQVQNNLPKVVFLTK